LGLDNERLRLVDGCRGEQSERPPGRSGFFELSGTVSLWLVDEDLERVVLRSVLRSVPAL